MESSHDGSIRATRVTDDAEDHSPKNEDSRNFKSSSHTDITITDHMELGSSEEPDGPDLHSQRLEGQSEADLAFLDSQDKILTGEDGTVPPDQWIVKKIIGEKVTGGVRYFLVDWEPTLEPASNVSKDLVKEWKDQKAKMQAPGMKRNRGSGNKKATDQSGVGKRRGAQRRC